MDSTRIAMSSEPAWDTCATGSKPSFVTTRVTGFIVPNSMRAVPPTLLTQSFGYSLLNRSRSDGRAQHTKCTTPCEATTHNYTAFHAFLPVFTHSFSIYVLLWARG